MQASADHILARAERTLRDRVYAACYTGWYALDVTMAPESAEPITFEQARAADYGPAGRGTRWGSPWSTTWLRVRGTVPSDWDLHETEFDIDLGWTWGPNTGEALLYDTAGRPLEALSPGRPRIPVHSRDVDLYLEAAANPMPTFDWHPTDTSLGPIPDAAGRMTISRVQLVRINRAAEQAANDLTLAIALTKELPDPARGLRALWQACNVIDDLTSDNPWQSVSAALAPLFDTENAPSAPRLHAVANAHIDTAWLWPFRETVRKAARSFANALAVMDDDPDLVFASSQVQHLAWMKQFYPDLFDRIKDRVAQGRWIVEGGTWVEPDGNMPSGESFARQFLQGQTWLQEHLGMTARSFWLPDTFGYSAGLPQIARGAGCDTFITQKLSWNSVNVFPHTTLLWEGIDGSQLLTHFPPADDYNCSVLPHELRKAGTKMAKQSVTEGLFLYGFGDGGGGPTREMAARVRQLSDAEGLPRVQHSTPADFFSTAADEDLPLWSGELYLEYHRGTLTSQADLKQLHRRCEIALREAEIWCTTATVQQGAAYPAEALRELWRELLVMQFHDVLPGTSIGWVHDEAMTRLRDVVDQAENLSEEALRTVAGDGDAVLHVTASPHGAAGAPPLGSVLASDPPSTVTATQRGDLIEVETNALQMQVRDGLVTSLRATANERETVPPGAAIGRLRLHPDRPVRWDAWDLDEQHEDGAIEVPVSGATVLSDGTVEVRREWRGSTFTQYLRLGPRGLEITTEVDWRADDVLLRLECDLDVHANMSSAETMYGYLQRPITVNTSWDRAKFETCAHRWLHVGDGGFGVVLLTPTTYGSHITRRQRTGHGMFTRVALSLLRAPAFPDPRREHGQHTFRHIVVPGAGPAQAVALADEESFGIRTVTGSAFPPVVRTMGDTVRIEAVKLAEDGSGDVIVRLRETAGSRGVGGVIAKAAVECDLIERPLADAGSATMEFGPFEVKTLRLRPADLTCDQRHR